MNMYSYTLASTFANTQKSDDVFTVNSDYDSPEIREFVVADDIIDAYKKVISITVDLNGASSNYIWKLKNLENAYFAGLDGKNEHHECKCDCDECECDAIN